MVVGWAELMVVCSVEMSAVSMVGKKVFQMVESMAV